MEKGNYLNALEIYKENINDLEELDIKGFTYSDSLNALGLAYSDIGDYKKAKEYLNKTLINDRKLIDKQDAHYATTLHNLAMVYDSEGSFQKAEELFRVFRNYHDTENHYETVVTLSELANFYTKYGFNKRAEQNINSNQN